MVAIVDYGAGNLRSVANAVNTLGYRTKGTGSPDDLLNAEAVTLPRVDAAVDTMANLRALQLVNRVRRFIAEDRPFFSICIRLQILFIVATNS